MITYYKGLFGANLLFRVHGSAVYRAMLPGIMSVMFFLAIHLAWRDDQSESEQEDLRHPYAIGVLVSSVTFLIIFRVSQAYGRYWEATGQIFHMMSKWLDATTHAGVYHLQQSHYENIKPPSFYDHPELDQYFLTRDRERGIERASSRDGDLVKGRAVVKSINVVKKVSVHSRRGYNPDITLESDEAYPLTGAPRLDGGFGSYYNDDTATYYDARDEQYATSRGFAGTKGGRTPPLFLQELAHLSSLAVAVALSTLRNDIEGAESPLDVYEPGAPWPEVDPAAIPGQKRSTSNFNLLLNFFGADRTAYQRTQYNARRPLPVLGGVSEAEIRFLQMARGASAKTQLSWNWLSEFIIREHLAGSLGKVGPPIVSRCFQFLSDGMIHYNHARKIMFIPFPFAHAQLSVVFVLLMIPAVPFLLDQYTTEAWLGAILTFFTTTCLAALHEVARELENPFRNAPNDLPLCTLQAMYNESLITMYAGYHPDAYWDAADATRRHSKRSKSSSGGSSAMAGVPEEAPVSVENGEVDLPKLQRVIEEQGRELERLRQQLEGSKPKST